MCEPSKDGQIPERHKQDGQRYCGVLIKNPIAREGETNNKQERAGLGESLNSCYQGASRPRAVFPEFDTFETNMISLYLPPGPKRAPRVQGDIDPPTREAVRLMIPDGFHSSIKGPV